MFRLLFSFLLILALGAGVTAQTVPVARPTMPKTTTTRTKTTTHRPAKKARRTTIRKTTVKSLGATKKVAPAPTAASSAVEGSNGNGATGSTEGADGKGQGSYAAPGMPIDVQSSKVDSYNGKAPDERTRAKKSTTLAPK